jgi:hypothetical protein
MHKQMIIPNSMVLRVLSADGRTREACLSGLNCMPPLLNPFFSLQNLILGDSSLFVFRATSTSFLVSAELVRACVQIAGGQQLNASSVLKLGLVLNRAKSERRELGEKAMGGETSKPALVPKEGSGMTAGADKDLRSQQEPSRKRKRSEDHKDGGTAPLNNRSTSPATTPKLGRRRSNSKKAKAGSSPPPRTPRIAATSPELSTAVDERTFKVYLAAFDIRRFTIPLYPRWVQPPPPNAELTRWPCHVVGWRGY